MRRLTLEEIIVAIKGWHPSPAPGMSVSGVSTDSRTILPNQLFFALVGERFDGHAFVEQALRSQAIAAVVSCKELAARLQGAGHAAILVDDTLAALGRLGSYHRRQSAGQVIAVTGSNGKTTTQKMIDHVLSGRFRGRSSPKSFNNAIGVPLTLLSMEPGDEYLVVEVGTNAPGEIAHLGSLAMPDIAVITSIGPAHLEKLGSVEGVLEEKLSLLPHVERGGFVAVCDDVEEQAMTRFVAGRRLNVLRFGLDESSDLRATDIRTDGPASTFKINGRFDLRCPAPGRHNVRNALAAVAVARRLGMEHAEIADRLQSFRLPPMRWETRELDGITMVFDGYNANPASMKAAIDTFAQSDFSGRRVLIVGDMLELGEAAPAFHEEIGRYAAESGFQKILAVGIHSGRLIVAAYRTGRKPFAFAFHSSEILAAHVSDYIESGDRILIKGSRGLQMERVAEAIERRYAPPAAARDSDRLCMMRT